MKSAFCSNVFEAQLLLDVSKLPEKNNILHDNIFRYYSEDCDTSCTLRSAHQFFDDGLSGSGLRRHRSNLRNDPNRIPIPKKRIHHYQGCL